MASEIVTYRGSGLNLRSELYLPAGSGRKSAVLVFPDVFGLGDHVRERAERLAKLGHAALACDIHGEGKLFDKIDAAIENLQPLYDDAETFRGVGLAALNALAVRADIDATRMASIGFWVPCPVSDLMCSMNQTVDCLRPPCQSAVSPSFTEKYWHSPFHGHV